MSSSNRPTVLVTDAHRGSALAFVRSLGRQGYRVIAADCAPRSAGAVSRYAAKSLTYPSPEQSPQAYVAAMLAAAQQEDVDLIIPITDPALLPLSREREQFAPHCRLAVPERESLEATRDKLLTFQLAEQLGIPSPKTHVVHSLAMALEATEQLDWPLVLKPRQSRRYNGSSIESLQVSYANNRDQLKAGLSVIDDYPVLLQQYTPGVGVGVELLMHEGRPIAAFQHRRLREMPVTGGPSSLRESEALDPVLYEHSVRLLKHVNWTGLAMVEFKVGQDGPKLMEVNGRVWGSLPLSLHSGVDFPRMLAELYLQGAPPADEPVRSSYQVGVRARNLELDLKWMVSVLFGAKPYPFLPPPPRSQSLAAFCQLFDWRCRWDALSWRDPAPAFRAAVKAGRGLYQKRRRRQSGAESANQGNVCLRSQ